MTLAETPSANERRTDEPQFGRTPPQAVEAEQSVLGAMMLSKDAIADVVEVLHREDFYRPAHTVIYDAILDLYSRGEPADAVTVSAELTNQGQLARVGGAPYLHTLISFVPTAASAAYYAQIVFDRAVLRRLVEAGTRITQMGYDSASGSGEAIDGVDGVVDRAQAEIYAVTERRSSEDYVQIHTLLQPTLDEIETIATNGGVGLGIPTGFRELDEITNGLQGGQMITVAGRPGSGKALALDTRLATPTGWTTMGEIRVGDLLFGADGRPTRVVAATDVMFDRACYEVEFSDGSVITADAEHQWMVTTRQSRRRYSSVLQRFSALEHRFAKVVHGVEADSLGVVTRTADRPTRYQVCTTETLAEAVRCETADRRVNFAVDCAEALQLDEAELPLPPYLLGAWLGDGTAASAQLTCADEQILERIRETVQARLRTLGVLNNKHIPAVYLRASEHQRRALLAGLLDTDGHATSAGTVEFSVTNERLARDVRELVCSLGYRASLRTKPVRGRTPESSTAYTVAFTAAERVFGLDRKSERQVQATRAGTRSRYVVDVRRVESVPVRCVQVDSIDHLYLAGETMIPTHNSTLALDFARASAVKHAKPTVIFSLEMGRTEIMMRLFSAEASVPLARIRSGHVDDQDWVKLAQRSGELAEAPLFIDDSPNLTMMEIRAKARRLSQRNDLSMVVIDYLQLMTSGKRVESRQQEVSEFSRAVKLLAKELDVPVVVLSQLNRGPEQRTDKRPMLSDLRESGSIEQDSDMVILVHREDMYEKESPRAGEADLIIAKHRNGRTGTVVASFQGHYSRFVDMAF
jgi:replicative DNA helicase